MKTVIIYVLAFLALVHGQDAIAETELHDAPLQVCRPGAIRTTPCTQCECVADGSRWDCVGMLCEGKYYHAMSPASQIQVSWMTVITVSLCLTAAQLRSA